MELKLYLQILRSNWWIILLTTLIAAGIALAGAVFLTPSFQTSARFVISPSMTADIKQDEIVDRLAALDKRSIVTTYSEVLSSDRIFTEAVEALNLDPASSAAYSRSTVVLPETNILELTVTGPNPEMTAEIANQIGREGIQYVQRLYTVYEIRFLDSAPIPQKPYRPQPARDISLAAGLGLIVGSLLAIVWEQYQTPLISFVKRPFEMDQSHAYTRQYLRDHLGDYNTQGEDKVWSLGMIHLPELNQFLVDLPKPSSQRMLRGLTDAMMKEIWGKDLLARWDQSTFSVFLPETRGDQAVQALERIQKELTNHIPYLSDGKDFQFTPQIGIAQKQAGETVTSVIDKVQSALQRAVENGHSPYLYSGEEEE